MAAAQRKTNPSEINAALKGVAHVAAIRPLSDFIVWDKNPRRYIDPAAAEELGESLIAQGQIHNLVARPRLDGKLETIVGNRRVTGLKLMVQAGKAKADHPINVTVVDVDDQMATLIAMAENISRESMNPIETCDALLKLTDDSVDLKEIARSVGLKVADVVDMIGVAKLEEPIKELIGTRKRRLEWGKAMARASPSLREEIMKAIEKSNDAYVSVQQINALMRTASLPVRNALFNPAEHNITVQEDLLEPGQGMIHDKDAFWTAQNAAIANLVTGLEKEGHTKVDVLRGQEFRDWEFERGETPEDAIAIVEVAADGNVIVHRHLLKKGAQAQRAADADLGESADALFGQDAEELNETSTISITHRAPSARAAEYLAAVRTTVASNLVSQDLRIAMAVTIAGLMGDRGVGVDWPVSAHGDNPFLANFNAHLDNAGEDPFSYALSLDNPSLTGLYGTCVAIRMRHQIGRKAAFIDESIVSRVLAHGRAQGFDLRSNWTPDAEFFEALTVQELRVLAAELLEPDEIGSDVGHTAKVDLVRILDQAFASAREGLGRLSATTEIRLNSWIPTYVI